MRRGFLFLCGLVLLAGCSFQVPGFLGRDGNSDGTYSLWGDGEQPGPPESVALRSATAERALRGVIIRGVAVAPTQGYFAPTLSPLNDSGPDAAGILTFEFIATPPLTPQPVGPERTRALSAAVFLSDGMLKKISGFRVKGGPTVQTLPLPAAPR